MENLRTPDEWTVKTLIYPKCENGNGNYNFERAEYSNIPIAKLKLCWQPVEDSTIINERGITNTSSYTAVVYDKVQLKKGDMVYISTEGYFIITSIKKYIKHCLITVNSTERRPKNV